MDMIRKPLKVRSKAIRQAARGKPCTLRLPGCMGGTETTVLAHLPMGGKGVGTKGSDIWAVFACASCHDVLDGRKAGQCTAEDMMRALYKTLHRLIEDEIVEVRDV